MIDRDDVMHYSWLHGQDKNTRTGKNYRNMVNDKNSMGNNFYKENISSCTGCLSHPYLKTWRGQKKGDLEGIQNVPGKVR